MTFNALLYEFIYEFLYAFYTKTEMNAFIYELIYAFYTKTEPFSFPQTEGEATPASTAVFAPFVTHPIDDQ